jgi:hypothetical protein
MPLTSYLMLRSPRKAGVSKHAQRWYKRKCTKRLSAQYLIWRAARMSSDSAVKASKVIFATLA